MKISALVVAAVLCSTAMQAQAAILLDDTFDTENGGVGLLNYNAFANWTVSDGTVDLIGNGFFDFFPASGLYVDMDGSTFDSGVLTSNLVFGPGSYTLSFQLAGSQRGDTNTVLVSLGSFSTSITLDSAVGLTDYVFPVSVLVADQLIFQQTAPSDNNNVGLILDNVLVESVIGVPEPLTLALFGSGLVGLAWMRRRRKPS